MRTMSYWDAPDPQNGSRTIHIPPDNQIPNQMGDQRDIWPTTRLMPVLPNYTQSTSPLERIIAITGNHLQEAASRRAQNGRNR